MVKKNKFIECFVGEKWVVFYVDFLLLLFVFFIVFYVILVVNKFKVEVLKIEFIKIFNYVFKLEVM